MITRDTTEEAWAVADRLLTGSTKPTSNGCTRTSPAVNRRASAAWSSCTTAAWTSWRYPPNLWAGVDLLRGGAGTALVGSHEEVAVRIIEYSRLAITHFILSGYPHLEEAYWFGEGVLPILERKRLWRHPHPPAYRSVGTPFARASTS